MTAISYEFFKNVDHVRIYKALKSENIIECGGLSNEQCLIKCNVNGIDGLAQSVCKKFNNLISSLCSSKLDVPRNKCLNDSDYKYLNFWANFELNGKYFNNNESIEEFGRNIEENKFQECINDYKLKEALVHIQKEDLNKMKILDKLYESYYEMHEIIFSNSIENIGKCLLFSRKCIEEYKSAITEFQNTKDNFYNALMKYENNYIKLHAEAVRKNTSFEEYIEKIPIEYKISDLSFYSAEYDRKKIILISLLGSAFAIISILIYIYKFTPFGARMCARKRNKKKKFLTRDDTNNTLQCFDAFSHANTNNKMYNLAYNAV
ncbi:unnamed protein product [Plasmodium vivax]|uniref:(malaria parasite P. vivax) hypothetical protein n=1 Tax=Plasmodium vivax TaxID=5855 RepID=A0A8S4HGL0_PLAVI|nr:unnamed protein product [Plasmodium vivax]